MIDRRSISPEEREWLKWTFGAALISATVTGVVNLCVNEIQGALQRRRDREKQ